MNGTILTRSALVLNLNGRSVDLDSGANGSTFAAEDHGTTVTLAAEAWADMGEPTQITVTIQPGDHLTES